MSTLFAVLLILAAGTSTDAARFYPTNKVEASQSGNGTKNSLLIERLLDHVSPFGAGDPSSIVNYFAGHQTEPGGSDGYYGFSATFDVYDPSLSPEQYSLASVWLVDAGDGKITSLNAIQIGWEVTPSSYGDSRAHFAAIWTTDGFQKTGCRNTNLCPAGFQPAKNAPMSLGDDIISGDWVVHSGLNDAAPALIGRFPKSLFDGGLADRATTIQMGGYVSARTTNLAPMGSGYLPADSSTAAASIRDIQFIDQSGHAWPVTRNLPVYVTDPYTYNVGPMADGRCMILS